MIDPTFKNIKKLIAFSFKNGDNNLARDSCDKCYTSLAEIRDFNALIAIKPFFDQPIKYK